MNVPLRFIAIGLGNVLCANKIYMITAPEGKASIRLWQAAKKEGRYLDCARRRKVRSLIVMDDNRVIGCIFGPTTMLARLTRACTDFISDEKEEAEALAAERIAEEEDEDETDGEEAEGDEDETEEE